MRGSVQALVVCGVLVSGLAPVSMVFAQAAGAGSACTASWTGFAGDGNWDDVENWSPEMVPASSSDVCITQDLRAIVSVSSNVTVHSLTLSLGATVIVGAPRFTVAGALRGAEGEMLLEKSTRTDAVTLTAGSIDVGNVSSNGSNVITTPRFDISLLGVLGGTTTLTHAPANLSGTTFSGGGIEVSSGVLRMPGDIHTLDGQLLTGTDGIQDASGGNALAQLSAIGTSGSLRLLSGTLTVTGDLANSGSIALGGGNREYGETGGTLAVPGTFTQLPGGSTSLANSLSRLQAASVQIDAGGSIGSHGGTVSGPVVNNGVLDASGTLSGPAVNDGVLDASGTNVVGSYTQNADGVLEVPAISGAALLAVQETARLGGTLAITTFAVPTPGSSITVMSFTSATGAFSTTPLGFALKTQSTSLVAIATPQLAVTPTSNAKGGTEHFTVADFQAGETVTIHLGTTGAPPLASVQIPANGLASGTFTVPASAAAGKHQVLAAGGSSHRLATTALEIT
jgi:hypothetical protein